MIDRARLERDQFSKHDHFIAYLEILLHERQVPPPAVEPRCPVVENEFENGFRVLLEPFNAKREDRSARDGWLVQLELDNRLELAAVLVTPWPVQQKRSEERRVGKECRSRWSPYH